MRFDPPNGPLYTLRLDRERYEDLRDWLTERLRYTDPTRLGEDSCAAFCVFAAEWWRRNHESGPWKWAGIQRALGIEDVRQDDLRAWTERGLRRLDRKLVRLAGSTRYLVSLATEGGFPLGLVKRQGSYLHALFSALFDHLEATSNLSPSAEEVAALAERRAAYLPRSLRQRPLFHLVGHLVAQLWPLIREVAGKEAPLELLDAEHPGWRASLPIELEDADVLTFLERLIAEGSEAVAPQGRGFEITSHLAQDDTGAWRLIRAFSAPERLGGEQARALLGEHANAPAVRVRMVGISGDAVAAVLRRHESAFYTEHISGARLRDDPGEVEIELVSKAALPSRVVVPGGMALGQLPWTFRHRRGRWELASTGSCRIPDDVVRVALCSGSDTSATVRRDIGELPALQRDLVEIEGTLTAPAPEGRVEIECGRSERGATAFFWSGERQPDLAARRPVFRGWPSLFEEGAAGSRRQRPGFEAKGSGGWGKPDTCYGDVLVRHTTRQGRLLLLQWVQVVPQDFKIHLEVGEASGRVVVQSARLLDAGIRSAPSVRVERERVPGGWAFGITLDGTERPAELTLLLDFGGRPVVGSVACPLASREILDREGKPVLSNSTFHVGLLGGVRIKITEPRPQRHYLEAVVVGTDHRRTFAVPQCGAGPTSELDLRAIQDDVRALLAQSPDVDGEVELQLFTPGATGLARRRLRVRRYDWRPELDKHEGDVVLADAPHEDTVVEARSFADLSHPEVLPRLRSARLHGARWVFDPRNRTPGPWLITVRDGAWYRGRPTLWTVAGDTAADGLDGALQLAAPEARRAAIRASFDGLAADLDHPDWIVFDRILDACADLPAATFDAVTTALEHPVLPLVLLRLTWQEPQHRLRIFESLEELPACWWLLPRASWFSAFDTIFAASEEDDEDSGVSVVVEAVEGLRAVVDVGALAFEWCAARGHTAPHDLGDGYRMARLPEGNHAARGRRKELATQLVARHRDAVQLPAPSIPEVPHSLRVEHWSSADAWIQAPASAAHRVLTAEDMPDLALAGAFRDAHDFDPDYFRECWNLTLCLALAQENR